jgi:hypothetical protein
MNTIEFVNKLAEAGCHPRKSRNGYQARCPAHEDNNPSLSISSGRKNNILVHCHAGCSPTDIVWLFAPIRGSFMRLSVLEAVGSSLPCPEDRVL